MTDTPRNTGSAALRASLAAGPIILLLFGIGNLLSGKEVVIAIDQPSIGPALYLMLGVSFGAVIISIIPNLIGTIVMAWLGARNLGMRHPAMWAFAGAAAAGVPAWLASRASPEVSITAWWAGMGAISALLCRSRVRWNE